MKSIAITEQILTGNLFSESGYDELASARKYAALLRAAWLKQAAIDWPGAEISINIEIQRASGCGRGLCIEGELRNGDPVLLDEQVPWYEDIAGKIYEQFDDWAVEAE